MAENGFCLMYSFAFHYLSTMCREVYRLECGIWKHLTCMWEHLLCPPSAAPPPTCQETEEMTRRATGERSYLSFKMRHF